MTHRTFIVLVSVTFLLLGLLVYGASLRNEFIRWDDGLLIYENPAIREISPWSIGRIFTTYDPELYIPLTLFSYQIDYQIGGIEPFVYHLQSFLWHIGNAILIVFVAGKLLRSHLAGILCGLLFLLHPLHTEAVVWASGRKDVLSTFWFLASLLLYLRYREGGDRRFLIGSIAAFLPALLAKVTVVTLPVVLILVDYLQGRRWYARQALLEKIPYFIFSILFGVIALFGKTAVLGQTMLMKQLLISAKSAAFALRTLFLPYGFSVLYIHDAPLSLLEPSIAASLLVVALLITASIFFAKKNRLVTFGILFFLLTLFPSSTNSAKGMMELYFTSDRYAYIPSIGLLLVVSMLLLKCLRRLPVPQRSHVRASIVLCVILFGGLGSLAFAQSRTWHDTETVFRHVLAIYPRSHVAHANIGGIYRRQGDLEKAKSEYEAANAIVPDVRTMSNLAAIERQQGNIEKAIEIYQEGMKLDPNDADPYYGLGVVRAQLGDFTGAERLYRQALSLNPSLDEVWSNLGTALKQQGRNEEAVQAYTQALAVNPYFALARFNLAVTLAAQGKADDAIAHYRRVIADEPAFTTARINLGLLLYEQGKGEASIEVFRSVLQYDPQNRAALSALTQMGVR